MERLKAWMGETVAVVNHALERTLPKADLAPSTLHEAMRYSVIGGGKRLRPLLVAMCAQMCGETVQEALPAACAIEYVHCYSLIHDDLPAMDNDDLRRGRLTCHRAYDEATAILAGDALLTFAFEVLAGTYNPRKSLAAVRTLARAAGTAGMVGGQALDLESEGKKIEPEELEGIHRRKTGALIAAACRLGGIVADAPEDRLELLTEYGRQVGLLFQITDDILDCTATAEELGKTPGKDLHAGKNTYVTVYGREQAQKMAREVAGEAYRIIGGVGEEALYLRLLIDYVLERRS